MSSTPFTIVIHNKSTFNSSKNNHTNNNNVRIRTHNELLLHRVAGFACRNMQVSYSSWLQGDTKPVSVALLLTTFSSFVKTIIVSIVINRWKYNVLSAKTKSSRFFLDTPKIYVPRNWWSSFSGYLPSSFYASPSSSFTFWQSSLQTLKTISTLQWPQAREVMNGRIMPLA